MSEPAGPAAAAEVEVEVEEDARRARVPGGRPLASRALVVIGVSAATVVLLLFLWHAREVLLLGFAGVLLGVFLRRLATITSTFTRLPVRWSLVLVILALVGALVGAFWAQGPEIAAEVRALRTELPQAAQLLQARLERYDWGARAVQAIPSAEAIIPDESDAIAQATGVVSRTFRALASFAIILFLGIVLAATPGVYVRGLLALLPEERVARGREVLRRLYDTLWWWLLGRVIAMTFIGVTTGVGLWLLDVPLAFILGLLAAFLSFIPNLGPILSAIPAILLALVQGPQMALWVALLYGGVQAVESYVLDPIIDRKTVYLPPALTILAQLTLAIFAGLLGVALATPLTAALVVLLTMLYVQDVLGRRDIELQSH